MCSGRRLGRNRATDPGVAEQRARNLRDPETRRRQTQAMMANPKAVAALRRSARKAGRAVTADPVKRAARKQRLDDQRAASLLSRDVNAAARFRVPLALLREFRAMRRKKMTAVEARAVLVVSYPDQFVDFAKADLIAAARAAGPRPPVNTPQHAAWTRKVHGLGEVRS